MPTQEAKHKLAAILIADVKGYSSLMGEDKAWADQMFTTYKDIIITYISAHKGRLVHSLGDNLLAEFADALDAVQCAVEIQKELKIHNTQLPENRRMEFRIGINQGDVIEEGDKISGDGVNVTAKIESLAAAGGVCISGAAYDYVKRKLVYRYEYLGEQSVKNIEKPARVYRVLIDPKGFVSRLSIWKGTVVKQWERLSPVVKVVIVLVALANGVWQIYPRLSGSPGHVPPKEKIVSSASDKALTSVPPAPLEVASKDKMAFPLPDKPSIAVLPFVNMSEDPKQEYFSDGITEDLITDLSKISGLLVIARNSTFTYKGKSVKIKQVAEELGVRYVLEGSVRKAGDDIRINAQLIDALSGTHLWAERYDGKIVKIFALQDQVTRKIVSALAVKLTVSEKEQTGKRGTENIAAYDALMRGWDHYHRWTADDFGKAVVFFKEALELDPNYGQAYAALAKVYLQVAGNPQLVPRLNMSWFEARLRAGEYTRLALKKPTALAYADSAYMYLYRRQYQEAISEAKRGLALEPNNPICLRAMSGVLIWAGKPKEGIEYLNKWIRVDPRDRPEYLKFLSLAHLYMGEIAEAAHLLEQGLKLNPEEVGGMDILAVCYSLLGRDQDARTMLDLRRKKSADVAPVGYIMFVAPFKDRAVADRYAEGMIKAGFPPGQIAGGYFPAFKENQLTGAEIKKLLLGTKVTGINFISGQPWWLDRKKNGELTWRGSGPIPSDTGRSRIEGDMICNQYKQMLWGIEYCMTVFRNPGGKYESKDEYFACSDIGFIPYSLVK